MNHMLDAALIQSPKAGVAEMYFYRYLWGWCFNLNDVHWVSLCLDDDAWRADPTLADLFSPVSGPAGVKVASPSAGEPRLCGPSFPVASVVCLPSGCSSAAAACESWLRLAALSASASDRIWDAGRASGALSAWEEWEKTLKSSQKCWLTQTLSPLLLPVVHGLLLPLTYCS